MSGAYDDIINLPRPVSTKHPRMPMIGRAAQFSPFAALSGYDAAIQETARLTDQKIDLDENARTALDEKLRFLAETAEEHPKVTITYFLPDKRKDGGEYVPIAGAVKMVDSVHRELVMMNGATIPMEDILDITGDLFKAFYL